jgi:prefoldin subunit 5
MIEVIVSVGIAAVTGMAAVTTRLHGRIHELDKRIDQVELRVAEEYVSKEDLAGMIDRVEGHLIRLENKLDKLTYR